MFESFCCDICGGSLNTRGGGVAKGGWVLVSNGNEMIWGHQRQGTTCVHTNHTNTAIIQ